MASGGGRVAPFGPPLVSLSCFWALLAASCLAKAPPEAKKKPPGSILGAVLAPTACFFYDLLGSPRGVFFITLSNLFLQQNCSENRDQRVLRVKSAQHGNTVKHKSCFKIFEVPRTAGRTASRPTEKKQMY